MARRDYWKRSADEFWLAADFRSWPIQPGETLVETNARGSIGVVVRDVDGNDVTSQLVEGAPIIDMVGRPADPDRGVDAIPPNVRLLVFTIAGAAPATYFFEFIGPTSDGELLTIHAPLEVRRA